MAAVLNGSHNRYTVTDARMMQIADLNVKLLILGAGSPMNDRNGWFSAGLLAGQDA